ncbi:MAG TPA: adenosylcobalamin-dependent ribonucleoside-diphosphate reductase [Natronosporangium sp.]|nr:adenosylcobalamin-dependent ribonucleoside-diphosphate reductase [Natronosporangium sp.]
MTRAGGGPARAGPVEQVRKRDGRVVPFDRGRIVEAIFRAAREANRPDRALAERTAAAVVEELERRGGVPAVEDIQDLVEHALMAAGLYDVARRYVLYRRRRAEVRGAKQMLGVRDELKLSVNAAAVLAERYLRRDEHGEIIESTGGLMDRVAGHVARAEDHYVPGSSPRWSAEFAGMLRGLRFLPNSPTLMNAGTGMGLLSGCFVLPVEDSLRSIFDAVTQMALIHQAGGGTGFSFSRLRPRGDVVRTTHGTASGPVSFMRVFDTATDVIKQGGRRRGANMAVLDVSHPDVEEFILAKARAGGFDNFNFSVGVDDEFMRAVEADAAHRLVNPRTGKVVRELPARQLFDRIAAAAWHTGDPGLVFLDRVAADNPVPRLGRIEATNPCGEVPLLPYESCNLGSVNLARMRSGGEVDWARLRATVRLGVRFLDDVIDVNRYPTPQVEQASRRTRKIGLGVMGLAELLAATGIPYDSEEAVALAGRIAATVAGEARQASRDLARERGPFPAWEDSELAARGEPPQRNAQLVSIAPTGTISIIAGTSAGIEPMFAISYVRNVLGRRLTEVNPLFESLARERGFYRDELMTGIARTGGVRDDPTVPPDIRRAFVTALEVAPQWHLRMQAAFQEHADAAVSKTVNLPPEATVADVRDIYLQAWHQRVKGITVYRYGSKDRQVLTFLSGDRANPRPPVSVDQEYAGGCTGHVCEF